MPDPIPAPGPNPFGGPPAADPFRAPAPRPVPVAPAAPSRPYAPLAALLSYLVPGLGQVLQGRILKGLLFLVCLYGLFFYGMWLGRWSNVYLPNTADERNNTWNLPRPLANVYNRLQYAGQFFIGVAAWPALLQYNDAWPVPASEPFWHTFQRTPYERRTGNADDDPNVAPPGWPGRTLNELQAEGKAWDLAWVYTVIAGVLNILVIYDAFAGPAFGPEPQPREGRP